ncbi:hypothetical protein ZWY2020_014100 [Hordeum vulgare]|nr:hypothetical protein ZWY2020_014100 [Hordeum vulgare]
MGRGTGLKYPRLGAQRNRRNQQPTELASSPRRSAKKPLAPTFATAQQRAPTAGERWTGSTTGSTWLRSRAHGTYLNARGDGRSVSLRRRRASLKAAWTVHIHQGDVPYLLLHSAAYGRYLAANGPRAEQRHYDEPEVLQAIMWQAFQTGIGDEVVLRNVGGRYLRANRRHLSWNTGGVSVEDTDNAGTMMCWTVQPIPAREAGMPDLPAPPNHFLYTVLGQAWRLIEFVRANAEGLYDEDDWHMFASGERTMSCDTLMSTQYRESSEREDRQFTFS